MQNVMHLTVSAFDREANSKACTPGIWKDYNIKLAITNFGGALDKLTRSGCEMVLRGWSPEAGNNFKCFKPTTINTAILTSAKEAWFVETDEDPMASHDQELTDEELMPSHEQRTPSHTQH